MIRRLSIHAAQRMSDAGMLTAPQKVINILSSLRNRGFRKPTKTMDGEYIIADHGVWVIKGDTIATYISTKRLSQESSEALRAYQTFFPSNKKAA